MNNKKISEFGEKLLFYDVGKYLSISESFDIISNSWKFVWIYDLQSDEAVKEKNK